MRLKVFFRAVGWWQNSVSCGVGLGSHFLEAACHSLPHALSTLYNMAVYVFQANRGSSFQSPTMVSCTTRHSEREPYSVLSTFNVGR